MITLTTYQCELCGAKFDVLEECQKHEDSHPRPEDLKYVGAASWAAAGGVPQVVYMEFGGVKYGYRSPDPVGDEEAKIRPVDVRPLPIEPIKPLEG